MRGLKLSHVSLSPIFTLLPSHFFISFYSFTISLLLFLSFLLFYFLSLLLPFPISPCFPISLICLSFSYPVFFVNYYFIIYYSSFFSYSIILSHSFSIFPLSFISCFFHVFMFRSSFLFFFFKCLFSFSYFLFLFFLPTRVCECQSSEKLSLSVFLFDVPSCYFYLHYFIISISKSFLLTLLFLHLTFE